MRKDWEDLYGYKTELDIGEADASLYPALKKNAEEHPDDIALEYYRTRIKYGRLIEEIDKAAHAFREMGLGKGSVVSLCHSGIPATVISVYALDKIGASISFLDSRMSGMRIAEMTSRTDSETALMTVSQFKEFEAYLKYSPVNKIILSVPGDYTNIIDRLSFTVEDIMENRGSRSGFDIPDHITVVRWKDVVMTAKPEEDELESGKYSQMIFHIGVDSQSGSSVVISPEALNTAAYISGFQLNFADSGIRKQLRILSAVETAFVYGMGTVNATLLSGGSLILYGCSRTSLPVREILEYKPDVITAYPTVAYEFMTDKWLRRNDLSFIKILFIGGRVMPGSKYDELRNYFRRNGWTTKIIRTYGPSETAGICMYNPPELDNPGAMGIPLPGILVKILDRETLSDVPLGEQGAICINSPAIMDGIYNSPQTDDLIRQLPDGRTWVITSDNGHTDERGIFYFDGSVNRMLLSDGFYVFPSVIELTIKGIYGVNEACIVKSADKEQGLIAVIEPSEDAIVDADRLMELKRKIIDECEQTFQPYMIPSSVEFRAYIPRTDVGDPDYEEIMRQISADNDEV